jgi:AcrR family transcriptional regulator
MYEIYTLASRHPASRRTDPRSKLERDRVIVAAKQILDREGIDALTMRRLATELGVAPMTLYSYVHDKDDLLRAVTEEIARELRLPEGNGPWREEMAQLMQALYRVLVANPFIVELRLRGPIVGREALRLNDAGLRILENAGFSKEQAAFGYRSLLVVTYGFAAFGPPADSDADAGVVELAVGELSATDYPHLTAASAQTVATHTGDSGLFEHMLELALDGLETQLERAAGRRAPTAPARS